MLPPCKAALRAEELPSYPMNRLIQLNGAQKGRVIELAKGRWRIGRHQENEIRIEGEGISSFHGEMRVAEIGIYLSDSESTNGIFVDGCRFPKGMLVTGQVLQIGELQFRVELDEVPITIKVPAQVPQRSPNYLQDGNSACQIHSDELAEFKCTKCEITLCPPCARRIGLAGSNPLVFCIECAGECVALHPTKVVAQQNSILAVVSRMIAALHVACPKFLDFRKPKQ